MKTAWFALALFGIWMFANVVVMFVYDFRGVSHIARRPGKEETMSDWQFYWYYGRGSFARQGGWKKMWPRLAIFAAFAIPLLTLEWLHAAVTSGMRRL